MASNDGFEQVVPPPAPAQASAPAPSEDGFEQVKPGDSDGFEVVKPAAEGLIPRVGKAIGHGVMGVARGLSEAAASPVTAFQASQQGSQLEKTMNALPEPDINKMVEKGYSEQQIHNVLKGHADTQASLAQDVEEMGKTGVKSTAEALATYGTLPLGGMGAEGAIAKTGLAKVGEHIAEGAAFGGAYGTAHGGIQAGADAAARGEGAGHIFGAILGGAAKEGALNAALGGVISPVLHGVIGPGWDILSGKASRNAAAAAQETAARAATSTAAVQAFDKNFQPFMLGDRFAADIEAATASKIPDSQLAAQIMSKLQNIPPEEIDPGMIDIMTKKIGQYRAQAHVAVAGGNAGLYPEVELPPVAEGVPPAGARVPLATDITEPTGGPAPDQTPPGVAEPVQPAAPGANIPVAPPEGFEPGQPSVGAPPPGIPLAGVEPQAPTQQMTQAPGLSQPLGTQAGPSSEPRPLEPEPRPVPAPTEPPTANITRGVPYTEVQPGAAPQQGATPTTSQVSKAKLPGGPSHDPARASQAMNDLGVPTGNPGWQTIGDVAYRTSPYEGRNVVELNYIENLGDEKGAGAAVLKKLTKVADEHQVPMTLNALPLPRGNGKGRIPIDKLVEFYKKHGFSVVDEGDGWANMRREPVLPVKADPEVLTGLKAAAGDAKVVAERIEGLTTDRAHMAAGNVVEGKPLVSPKAGFFTRLDEHLGRIGDAADARIKARLSQPSLGAAGGSELLSAKDLAISAAAKMFQMGIRGTKALTEALIKVHGDVIKPMVAKAIEDGRKLLSRLIANDTPTAKQLAAIKETYQSGAGGKDWYNETWGWLQQHFGDDAEMVGRFISATSLGNSTEGGATQTLKAYAQWKLGLPFDGHLNKVHASSLLKATRGEVFGDGKAQGFLGAITGDPNAVALDRHVMRTLGFKNAGKATGKSALSNSTYRLYSSIIRDLAAGEGVTPREYQSGLWVGKKIGDEQMAEQTGVTTRGGSFRPMEYLIGKRLGGLTPAEWVEQNKINVTSLRNATDGVQQARSAGGYSFNNSDFSEFKKPGFIVTMDHKVLPTGEASGTKVLEFAKRYKDLTGKYPGTLTGLYSRSDDPGNMHMDFNIHLPDHPGNEEFAKRLGLEGRQYAVGYVDKAGQYHDISTGYDPAIHGPQFPQRKVADIEAQLDAMKFPTFDTPGTDAKFLPPTMSQHAKLQFDPEIHQYAIDNPAMALSKYAEVAGKTPEEIKQMINDGNFKPMTDAGVAGAVVVNKDGIVWQYQDPVAPSYNTMTAIGSLRKNPMAMLDKLKGLDILRGHDVIEQYRNEAGAVSLGKRGEPAPDAEVNKVFAKMTQTGGRVVPETALSESRGVGSFWLLPNGRIVRSPMTHSGQARAMKIPGVRDYAGAEGRGSAGVQRLLNMGIIRVQSSYGAVAFDVAAAPTDIQRSILKRAATTQKFWAGQALDERGRPLHYAHSDSGTPIHHFLASLNK